MGAGAGDSIGGRGLPGSGAVAPGSTAGRNATGGRGTRSVTRNPAATGSVAPGRPATPGTLAYELRNMSESQRRELRRSCATVRASPENYEADLRGLCNLLSRMSGL
jgi:hypothetical protein